MKKWFVASIAILSAYATAQPSLGTSLTLNTSWTSDGTPGQDYRGYISGLNGLGPLKDDRALASSFGRGTCFCSEIVKANYGLLEDTSSVSASSNTNPEDGGQNSAGAFVQSTVTFQDSLKIWSTRLAHGAKTLLKIGLNLNAYVGDGGFNPYYSASAEYEGTLTISAVGPGRGQTRYEELFTDDFPSNDGLRSYTYAVIEMPCWVGGTVNITGTLRPIAQASEESTDETGESVGATFHASLKTTVTPADYTTFKAASKALYN